MRKIIDFIIDFFDEPVETHPRMNFIPDFVFNIFFFLITIAVIVGVGKWLLSYIWS